MMLAGCTTGPLSMLDPAGVGAARITHLWWPMFWSSVAILVLMTSLGLYVAFRDPAKPSGVSPALLIGGGGVAFPAVVLCVLLVYGLRSGDALLPPSSDESAFRVQVTAHQWWWEVAYPQAAGGTLHTANEIYIPAGRPVDIELRAADVIHSFWIPRLGGKLDALPGHTTVLRIAAAQPGVYLGQCAEFCGAQHARMRLAAEVLDEPALLRKLAALADATRAEYARDTAGARVFSRTCAECHSIDSRESSPNIGPNLAGFAQRHFIGAGTLPNTAANLRTWLRRHQQLKPGNRMPSHAQLDPQMLDAVAAFLERGQ